MHRGDVDDASEAACAHAGHGGAHGVEGAAQIDGQDGVPALGRELGDAAGVLNAGVVDEDVDGGERGLGTRHQAGGLAGVGEVGLHIGRTHAVHGGQALGQRAALRLGLDAMQKASLFGNATALFAIKARLTRRQYLALMRELWEVTESQIALMEVPAGAPLKAGVA